VRTSDYTNFLPAFFYPVHLRDSYIALRAFNVELATIKENVRHETLGRMRTAWWREAVDGVYKVSLSLSRCRPVFSISLTRRLLGSHFETPCPDRFEKGNFSSEALEISL
jgi:Squalene/phytoene synthase